MPVTHIELSMLMPGDVLLVRGDSPISTGIVELDGGHYSHAALWGGSQVIESTLPKAREVSFEECAAHAQFIDVYRRASTTEPLHKVVAEARRFLGQPYGTIDLGVASLVVAVSAWMPGDWAEMNVLYGTGNLARMLGFLTAASDSSHVEGVTCSELVTRAYFRAGMPLSISLKGGREFKTHSFVRALTGLAARVANEESSAGDERCVALRDKAESVLISINENQCGAADDAELSYIQAAWEDRLCSGGLHELGAAEIRAKRLIAGQSWPATLVTPRLLEDSPDLALLGRLFDGLSKVKQ